MNKPLCSTQARRGRERSVQNRVSFFEESPGCFRSFGRAVLFAPGGRFLFDEPQGVDFRFQNIGCPRGLLRCQASCWCSEAIVRRHYLKMVAENEAEQFWGAI